jgi:hypothetical protein
MDSAPLLAKLRDLLAKATPGPPWRTMDEYIDSADRPPPIASAFYTFATMKGGEHHEEAVDNAALIIEAVNALPDLLTLIEALTARNREMEEGVQEIARRTELLIHQNTGRWNMTIEHDRRSYGVSDGNLSIARRLLTKGSDNAQR